MSDVRVVSTTPIAEDFRSPKNSPIVIDDSTDIAYYLDGSTVTPLQAVGGYRILHAETSLNFPNTASNGVSELTVTVTGAEAGDCVFLGPPSTIESGFTWSAYVSAANTVTIRLHNNSGSDVDPAAGTWHVSVLT